MGKHTQAPWRVLNPDRKPGDYVHVAGTNRDGTPRVVAAGYFRTREDADRFLACVNALEGIDDPAAALAQVRRRVEYVATWLDGKGDAHADILRDALDLLGGKS